MYCDGYWVSYCPDSGIERENPQTGKTELCEGYFCQVYEDEDYKNEVDSFCLAVGYEITDLSDASLERGIREYLSPAFLNCSDLNVQRANLAKKHAALDAPADNRKKGILDAMKELYEHVELFGKPALFTNARIDASTVPVEFYCYNLRGSDNDPGRPVTLELHVGVNHAGTVLTPEKVKIPDSGYKRVGNELNFLGEEMSLEQFCMEYQMNCSGLNVQRANPAKEHAALDAPADNRKKGILEQLSGRRELTQKKDPLKQKTNHTGRNEPSL